jgi:hypothetical protein
VTVKCAPSCPTIGYEECSKRFRGFGREVSSADRDRDAEEMLITQSSTIWLLRYAMCSWDLDGMYGSREG